jgi:hypothetical protein
MEEFDFAILIIDSFGIGLPAHVSYVSKFITICEAISRDWFEMMDLGMFYCELIFDADFLSLLDC